MQHACRPIHMGNKMNHYRYRYSFHKHKTSEFSTYFMVLFAQHSILTKMVSSNILQQLDRVVLSDSLFCVDPCAHCTEQLSACGAVCGGVCVLTHTTHGLSVQDTFLLNHHDHGDVSG